jgi:2-polyprenyl-3-methyl-5-hydroxy-6-metoxy-1,4-benzoquinol methylase
MKTVIAGKLQIAEYCGFARRDDLMSPEWDRYVESLPAPLGELEGWRDHWARRWEFPWAYHAISSYVTSKKGQARLLESGCGLTPVPFWLAADGCSVLGVDLDETCIAKWELANEHLGEMQGRANFKIANMEDLHEPDSSFDVAYSISAIEHTKKRAKVVSELVRVTVPGGLIVLTCDIDIVDSASVSPTELLQIQGVLFEATKPLHPVQTISPQSMLTFEQRTLLPLGTRRRATKALLHSVGIKQRYEQAIFAYAGIRI